MRESIYIQRSIRIVSIIVSFNKVFIRETLAINGQQMTP